LKKYLSVTRAGNDEPIVEELPDNMILDLGRSRGPQTDTKEAM
jgi:hypothetical protein